MSGHIAAVVKDWSGVGAEYFCTDPNGNGHRDRFKNRGTATAPMSDEQKSERREVVANNRAGGPPSPSVTSSSRPSSPGAPHPRGRCGG